MADNLPALPGDIDPGERVVTFVMHECRDCGERSEWFRSDDGDNPARHVWIEDHARKRRGHREFYLYSFSRTTTEVWFL